MTAKEFIKANRLRMPGAFAEKNTQGYVHDIIFRKPGEVSKVYTGKFCILKDVICQCADKDFNMVLDEETLRKARNEDLEELSTHCITKQELLKLWDDNNYLWAVLYS